MKIFEVNQNLLKNYYDNDKTILYCSLVKYCDNTKIKVYDSNENPICDIPNEYINEYINKTNILLFIHKGINDNTGLIEFYLDINL